MRLTIYTANPKSFYLFIYFLLLFKGKVLGLYFGLRSRNTSYRCCLRNTKILMVLDSFCCTGANKVALSLCLYISSLRNISRIHGLYSDCLQ